VGEEGHAQLVVAADTVQPGLGGGLGLADGVGAQVGQVDGLTLPQNISSG
jgi:hypothetical protein